MWDIKVIAGTFLVQRRVCGAGNIRVAKKDSS